MKRFAFTFAISVAAAAAGAGIALLLAPQSGQRTRRRLRHMTEEYVQDLRDHVSDTAHDLTESAHRISRDLGRKLKPVKVA